MVKNPPADIGDTGVIHGLGTKIPLAVGQLRPTQTKIINFLKQSRIIIPVVYYMMIKLNNTCETSIRCPVTIC